MKNVSFFLYLHEDLSGEPDVWKLGKAMTPYSAVRARQKYMWKTFKLDHLYFGRPKHINRLEENLKNDLFYCSATRLLRTGCQTELFKISADLLLAQINSTIKNLSLDVIKIDIPYYSASKSSDCPLKIPSELKSYHYLSDVINNNFGEDVFETIFNEFFIEQAKNKDCINDLFFDEDKRLF
jgi:hypothetical protein